MGSALRGGPVVVRDNEGLLISPGDDNLVGERESEVKVAQGVDPTAPQGAYIAVLIRKRQSVKKFWIKQTDDTWHKCAKSATVDTSPLDTWQHVSPKQQWVAFEVPYANMPHFPWTTKFGLNGEHLDPQDILWVAVRKEDGFGANHRLYGWTEYPKSSKRARAGARRRGAARPRRKAPKRPKHKR